MRKSLDKMKSLFDGQSSNAKGNTSKLSSTIKTDKIKFREFYVGAIINHPYKKEQRKRLSYKEHRENALAPRAEEGRNKLR